MDVFQFLDELGDARDPHADLLRRRFQLGIHADEVIAVAEAVPCRQPLVGIAVDICVKADRDDRIRRDQLPGGIVHEDTEGSHLVEGQLAAFRNLIHCVPAGSVRLRPVAQGEFRCRAELQLIGVGRNRGFVDAERESGRIGEVHLEFAESRDALVEGDVVSDLRQAVDHNQLFHCTALDIAAVVVDGQRVAEGALPVGEDDEVPAVRRLGGVLRLMQPVVQLGHRLDRRGGVTVGHVHARVADDGILSIQQRVVAARHRQRVKGLVFRRRKIRGVDIGRVGVLAGEIRRLQGDRHIVVVTDVRHLSLVRREEDRQRLVLRAVPAETDVNGQEADGISLTRSQKGRDRLRIAVHLKRDDAVLPKSPCADRNRLISGLPLIKAEERRVAPVIRGVGIIPGVIAHLAAELIRRHHRVCQGVAAQDLRAAVAHLDCPVDRIHRRGKAPIRLLGDPGQDRAAIDRHVGGQPRRRGIRVGRIPPQLPGLGGGHQVAVSVIAALVAGGGPAHGSPRVQIGACAVVVIVRHCDHVRGDVFCLLIQVRPAVVRNDDRLAFIQITKAAVLVAGNHPARSRRRVLRDREAERLPAVVPL